MTDTTDPLLGEIRSLAQGSGAEYEALQSCRGLLNLPVVQRVTSEHGTSPSHALLAVLEVAASRLEGTVGTKHRIARTEIANAALGLKAHAGIGGLHARLAALGENRRTELSTMRLYWRQVAPMFTAELRALPANIPIALAETVTLGGQWDYRLIHSDALIIMDERKPDRILFIRELQALQSVSSFWFPFGYPNDIREGVVTVKALANCKVEESSLSGLGEQETTLAIPDTEVGRSVRFAYEISIHSDQPDLPFFRFRGRAPGGTIRLGIQFDTRSLPRAVWSFSDKPFDYDPTRKTDQARRVHLSSLGYGETTFGRETIDRTLGIAWAWPSKR